MYLASIEPNVTRLVAVFTNCYKAIPSDKPELRAQFLQAIISATWSGSKDAREQVLSALKLEPNLDGQYPYLNEEKVPGLRI